MCLQFVPKFSRQLVGVVSAHRFADDGYGADSVAAYYTSVLPVGRNLCQLAQGHACRAAHYGYVLVGEVAVVFRLQHHLHRIVALPKGGYRQTVAEVNGKVG